MVLGQISKSAVSVSFLVMPGSGRPPRRWTPRIQTLERPGIDGATFIELARRTDRIAVIGLTDAESADECRVTEYDLRGLVGELVSYRDETARTWTNLMLLAADVNYSFTPYNTGIVKTAAASHWLINLNLLLQQTTEPVA